MKPTIITAALLAVGLFLRWWYVVKSRPKARWEHHAAVYDGKTVKHYRDDLPFDGSSDYVERERK